jgi:hypothetical protein
MPAPNINSERIRLAVQADLAMKRRPVVEALARSYGIASRDAKKAFHIGRLFAFRSRIVHQGHIQPIHALLSDYVAALYLDVLYDRLSLPSERFAAKVQKSPGIDISALAS